MPSPGGGPLKGKRKRCCFGSDNYEELLKSKRSVIRIHNDDDGLCCARVIIVTKAVADEDERLIIIKDSRSS